MTGGQPIHGHAFNGNPSPTYSSWQCMKARCLNPNHRHYRHYGGRGITICRRWIGSKRGEGFANFLADMGPRPKGHTLDRWPNPNGNYEPSNCRWATQMQQMETSRKTHYITLNGETRSFTQWSALMFDGDQSFVLRRMAKGWTPEEAILTPRIYGKNSKKLLPLKTRIRQNVENR